MPASGNRKRYNDLQNFHFLYHNVPTFHCVDANINKFFLWHSRYNRESIIWKADYWLLFDCHFLLWNGIFAFEYPAFEMVLFKIKHFIYLLPLPKPPSVLLIPIRKNLSAFLLGKTMFPSGETLILPSSRDSRYNTLHFESKVVCQRGTLWKPYFVGVCSHTSSKIQNKRHRPARSWCWSMPLICLHGLLTLSPILTVLFYHFRMYGTFADFEFFCGGSDGRVGRNDVIGQRKYSLFYVILHNKHRSLNSS